MKKRWGKRTSHLIRDLIALSVAVVFFTVGISIIWIASLKTPNLESFETRRVSQSTKIYDRTGEHLLYDVHENIRRTVIPFEMISRHIKNATVAIEDSEFYEHRGIQPKSIVRAVLVNLGARGFRQGGSTITQQVVKNSILSSEKKVSRKLKEWALALKLERFYSKETILGYYLNESPYGGNVYGVEEASQTFFGKKSFDVDVAEAAYLAALPKAPTFYSPYGNNRDKLEERRNLVLKRMFEEGFVGKEEYETALNEKVVFKPQEETGITAPHFVIFVKEFLEQKYGDNVVRDSGLRVITTLDLELQKIAEESVKKFALENEEKFNAENAGLVAIDPKTGEILVMVGSRDYFDTEIDGNFNVTLAKRQPGSAFKPFVYATAFEKGYTPDTVVFDLETEFSTECKPDGTPLAAGNEDKCYRPQNYDEKFRGPITLRSALAQSVNIPAVKVLYLAGLRDSIATAEVMGISTLTDPNRYGLTLVLGGGEVSLLEMTSAYGVLATDGIRNPYKAIIKIENSAGEVVEEVKPNPKAVLTVEVAQNINNILSDDEARAPSFGHRSALYIPGRQVAVKTGTTNDYRDAWILGYTPSLVAGAWAGNNDNSSMEKKVAGFIIAPLWNTFMSSALQKYPSETFREPPQVDQTIKPVLRGFWQGNQSYIIDKISGKLATEYTPLELREERVVSNIHSILYVVDRRNPRAEPPEHPENDLQFTLWEEPIRKWAEEQNIKNQNGEEVIPKETDDVHKLEFSPRLTIVSPTPTTRYLAKSPLIINLASSGRFPLSRVDFFVNDRYIGQSVKNPFSYQFVPETIEEARGQNTLRVIGYDSVLNKGETSVNFEVVF